MQWRGAEAVANAENARLEGALHAYCTRVMAEGVRFELTKPFGSPVFKTGAINHSATLPCFQSYYPKK
jgi:hypothetical protein